VEDKKENMPEVINQNDIQVVHTSPLSQAQDFLKAGGDLSTLKEMMALQRDHDAYQAKKAFTRAMAEFKADPPHISKDKVNTQYKSKYTSLGNLINSSLPKMSKCGLSHKWDLDHTDQKMIKVTCVVTHALGHSESTSMSAPADGSGSKNPIQMIKSTITYLKATTFESIMGLASSDANFDDDGQVHYAPVKYLTTDQAIDITDRLKDTGSDVVKFLLNFNSSSVEDIPMSQYGRALNLLKSKAAAQEKL